MSEASLANPASLHAAPVGGAISLPNTSQVSSEIEKDLAEEEASLLLQEQALRRAAESLEAKQLAAEKARIEFEARTELHSELKPRVELNSLQVGADPEIVPSFEEENRYRRQAETLRKAAAELARMREAVDAMRKTTEQEAMRTDEEEKRTGISDLEMFVKKTASNY